MTRVLLRQLFDHESCTYTYLLASRRGGEAILIDPVLERVDRYLQLLRDLAAELQPGARLYELGARAGERLLFYCACGERSAMAVELARKAGLDTARHRAGRLDARRRAGAPIAAD